jgi:K+/H+ antiporter YhaU regulatory subunit KhtT
MSQAQEKLPERLERTLRALSERYKNFLRRSGVKDEASILIHASAVYGAVMMMTYLLGSRCEEQVARSLELSREELRHVAEYLGEGKEIDARRIIIRLTMLEAIIRQVAAYCVGLEN